MLQLRAEECEFRFYHRQSIGQLRSQGRRTLAPQRCQFGFELMNLKFKSEDGIAEIHAVLSAFRFKAFNKFLDKHQKQGDSLGRQHSYCA